MSDQINEDWRNELITKGAAIDALKDNMFRLTLAEEQKCEGHVVWDEDVVFADVLEKALLALPPAQPQDIARDIATIIENEKDMRVMLQQRWIPVSKDTPKKRDWYLGIFKEPDTGWINPIPFICDYLLGKKTKATTKEGWILRGFTDGEEHIDYYFNLECVAWMPLPPSYKGDEDERD